MHITHRSFEILYNLILEKCSEKEGFYPAELKGARLYGYGNSKTDPKTIKGIIAQNPQVKEFVEEFNSKNYGKTVKAEEVINGKYLYDRFREFLKEQSTIELTGIYARIFFIFCGFPSIYEFMAKLLNEKEYEIQNEILKTHEGLMSKLAKTFYCGYYDRFGEVSEFKLTIDFHKNLSAKAEGLHESAIGPAQINRFEGKGKKVLDNIYFNLTAKDGSELNIILNSDKQNLKEVEIIRGMYLTVSGLSQLPFSGAMYCYDEDVVKDNLELIKELIDFVLKRDKPSYRMKPLFTETVREALENDETRRVIKKMVGSYLIFSFSEDKEDLFINKFFIHSDAKSELWTYSGDPEKPDKQPCILQASKSSEKERDQPPKDILSVEALDTKTQEVRNFAVLKTYFRDGTTDIYEGYFTGFGVKQPGALGGKIFMIRLDKDSRAKAHEDYPVEDFKIYSENVRLSGFEPVQVLLEYLEEVSRRKNKDYAISETSGFKGNLAFN